MVRIASPPRNAARVSPGDATTAPSDVHPLPQPTDNASMLLSRAITGLGLHDLRCDLVVADARAAGGEQRAVDPVAQARGLGGEPTLLFE